MACEKNILGIHTDADGEVCFSQVGRRPYRSKLSPATFVTRRVFRDAEKIRVIGCPENAALIVAMYLQEGKRKSFRFFPQEIGSPALCYGRMQDFEFVLNQIQQPDVPAQSCALWHRLSNLDYNNYLLINTLKSEKKYNDMVRRVFRYHPVYPAVSFLPTADMEAACRLVCEIIDPRWYNNIHRPGRASKLLEYLGINPRNFSALNGLIHPGRSNQRNWQRAELVLRTWKGNHKSASLSDTRNFLWRIENSENGIVRGALKASRAFIQFVRLTWLQALAQKSREVFVPDYFFKKREESEAWLQYVTHYKPV